VDAREELRLALVESALKDMEGRARENERVTALQGQTLSIVVEDTKKHADKETLDKLDDLTRNQILPDVAVLKNQAEQRPDGWLDTVLGFVERTMNHRGFRYAAAVLLVFGAGLLLHSCSDRLLDLGERLLDSQEETEDATEATAADIGEMNARQDSVADARARPKPPLRTGPDTTTSQP
jgi:hypothetical protein